MGIQEIKLLSIEIKIIEKIEIKNLQDRSSGICR